MSSVLFIMGSWQAPSELFLLRQMKMLAEANVLAGIVSANLSGSTSWHGIPVYGLADKAFENREIDRKPSLVNQIKLMRNILEKSEADTLLVQYGTLAVLLSEVLQQTHHRLFIHVHGRDTQTNMQSPEYIRSFVELAERATVICNSQETYSRLVEWGVNLARLVIKHYGVEIPPSPPMRASLNTISILHLGRLIDMKGPELTIKAFELACERGLRGKLVVAGDGVLRPACELLISRSRWSSFMRLTGAVDPVVGATLRNESDVFTQHAVQVASTGQIEAFGVSIVEAMAAALPVVTCPLGGIKETVINGVTGIYFESGDISGQADAFIKLASNSTLRHQLGKEGWKRAKENFSYEQEKSALLHLLM